MEKKEMSFIEIFGAAGKDLGKKLEKSNNGAMIMIAAEELTSKNFYSNIQGKGFRIAALLACVASEEKAFKTILERALMAAELKEQMDNK